MLKRVFNTIWLLTATIIVMCGCCKNNDDDPANVIVNNRTVLVYMLADNDLGLFYDFDDSNIEAMCESFDGKVIDGHLLVFHADNDVLPCLKEISKPYADKPCEIKILRTYPSAVSTDTATIQQVLNDVKLLAPSSHYGLIMWSHATGWLPQNKFYAPNRSSAPTSFGREGEEQLTMDIDVLAKAFDKLHYDFILFDACLMGCVEVAYELRNTCDRIIATATETVGEGFPYRRITPLLFSKNIDYKAVCNHYYEQVSGADYYGGTISLINTRHLEQLAEACRTVVQNKADEIANLNTLRIQYFDRKSTHVFYDLGHYMLSLGGEELYPIVDNALTQVVEYKAATPSFINIIISKYCGLSCYIPYTANDEMVEEFYSRLQWYQQVYNTHQ